MLIFDLKMSIIDKHFTKRKQKIEKIDLIFLRKKILAKIDQKFFSSGQRSTTLELLSCELQPKSSSEVFDESVGCPRSSDTC